MQELQHEHPTLGPIVETMREKFLKYWKEVPPVTILANCVHPAYKKKWAIIFLRKYYEFLGLPANNVEN